MKAIKFEGALRWTLGFLALALMSCGKNVSERYASDWFGRNEDALRKLEASILQHPAIRRIDSGMDLKFVEKFAAFNDATVAAYRVAEADCRRLGIENITIAREGHDSNGPLICTEFVLSAVGLGVSSGGWTSIQHTTDQTYIDSLGRHNVKLRELRSDGWYITISQ